MASTTPVQEQCRTLSAYISDIFHKISHICIHMQKSLQQSRYHVKSNIYIALLLSNYFILQFICERVQYAVCTHTQYT